MNLFPRSVRARLRAINIFTSSVALILACTAFLVYDAFSYRASVRMRARVLAEIVSSQITPALDFNDAAVARQILDALAAERGIETATVYDRQGRRFAQFVRPGVPAAPDAPGPDGERDADDSAEVVLPIQSGGARVGTVLLRTDLGISNRLASNAGILAAVLGVCILLVLLLSGPLERRVTASLTQLAGTVNEVVNRRDYGVRARKERDDEIGAVTDGINDMLAQIQARDAALELARNDLEKRVVERTESLRESEQRMRILVESAPEAIVILDADRSRFVDVNPKAVELFGLSRADLLDIGPLEVSPTLQPDGRSSDEASREKVGEAVDGGAPTFEWTFLAADGRHVACEVHLVRLPGGSGRQIRGSIVDITKRKEIDRMKNEFVSTVSHELRTPLTSIQGSLGLLANGVTGPLPPAARPLVDIAYKNSQRLIILINDILDSEKIAAGKMKFAFKTLDLLPLVEQAVEANKGYAAQFGVRIALGDIVPGARVEADADRLMQVFTNLISNACKFSPKGDVVRVTVAPFDGGYRVSIVDHGPGIPEEFRSRIFQKFSQADASDIRLKGGTGLGLNISKSIVEKHKGRIGFETGTDKGSTFFVELPAWNAPALVEPVPGKPRILHVDADPEIRRVAAFTLRDKAEVVGVESLAEARREIEARSFDLAILDVELPDGPGLDLVPFLNKPDRSRVPVILFHAQKPGRGQTNTIASALMKSLAANSDLPNSLRSMIPAPAVFGVP